MELLDERWTLLVVRELVTGSERFSELRRGLPRMSPSLLSKRLAQLERNGILEKQAKGSDVRYVLTEPGRQLRPVVEAIGRWGARFVGELGDEDLDPKLLLWDMHRNVDRAAVPAGRTVIHFHFVEAPHRSGDWWLVMTKNEVDVCDVDPGYPVAVTVSGGLRTMTEVWRGERTWSDAAAVGALQIDGPREHRRALAAWFRPPTFPVRPGS